MKSEHIDALIGLYRKALILLGVAFCISVLAVLANYLQYKNTISFLQLFLTMGVFSPATSFLGELIALPGMLYLYRLAKKLPLLTETQQKTQYIKIWAFQQTVGTLVSIGAVIMIPGSGMALQAGVAGLSIVFPIFAGAFLHLKARAINRSINAWEKATTEVSDNDYRPTKKANTDIGNEAGDLTGGMAPLIVAGLLLVINVVIETSFFFQMRNDSTFNFKTGEITYPTSMYVGMYQFLDIFVLSTIGIAMVVLAVLAKKRMPQKRFRAIIAMSAISLAIFPGTVAPALARALGPTVSAAEGKQNTIDSNRTITALDKTQLPAGFGMINEFYEGEPNSQVRTGVYNLDEPKIDATCEEVVAYVIGKGATEYRAGEKSELRELANGEAAVTDCIAIMKTYPVLKVQRTEVVSDSIYFYGTANFGALSPISFKLMLMKYGSTWEKPNAWGYEFVIATTYATDINAISGGLSQGTIEINELLTHVAQERLSAPNRNPTDPVFMTEILKSYKYKIPVKIFEPQPGVAKWLELTNSDGAHLCLSVQPWDEKKEGMPDPGFGYGLGFQDDLKTLDEFGGYGVAVEGGCKKP